MEGEGCGHEKLHEGSCCCILRGNLCARVCSADMCADI